MTIDQMPEGAKHLLDALSVMTVIGTIAQFLPPLAAAFSIVWMSLQIFGWCETRWQKRKSQD